VIHHVSLGVNDLNRARAFYDAVLPEIGLRFIKQSDRIVGYGLTDVYFSLEKPCDGGSATAGNGTHVAFRSGTRKVVESAHAKGIAAGGRCAGPPGVREAYDAHYYAAFLLDPDGNKIEIVTFAAD
jgi:catechol 2,3-dioxygenase-like lactoylglutathione lyase family enzyme